MTGCDPLGGVFEEKLFLMKKFFSTILSFSTKIRRYLGFSKDKVFQTNLELPPVLAMHLWVLPCFLLGWFASTFKCTHIGFVPGYCLGQTMRSGTRKKTSMTAMRTMMFSQSVACRVMARDLGSTLYDDSAASTCL